MRNFARDIYDENKRRNERLISLEALTMAELSQLSIFDDSLLCPLCLFSQFYTKIDFLENFATEP